MALRMTGGAEIVFNSGDAGGNGETGDTRAAAEPPYRVEQPGKQSFSANRPAELDIRCFILATDVHLRYDIA